MQVIGRRIVADPDSGADKEGNIWMVGEKLEKYSRDGKLLGQCGKVFRPMHSMYFPVPANPDPRNDEFYRPQAIIIDNNNNICVADTENNRIRTVDQNGKFVSQFLINAPCALSIDKNGNYWVVGNHKWVVELDRNGRSLRQVGAGRLIHPTDVDVDGAGNVWIVDAGEEPRGFIQITSVNGVRTPPPPKPPAPSPRVLRFSFQNIAAHFQTVVRLRACRRTLANEGIKTSV